MRSIITLNPVFRIIFMMSGLTIRFGSVAQEINKEVFVVKPYEPTLSDATKISLMPSVENIDATIPSISYRITPLPFDTKFEVSPIKPAKMVSSTLPKIYNSYLKLGMGNYISPLVEFNISNLYSKDYAVGAMLKHKSSHANVVLANDDKVPGGYAINNLNLYGKKFYNKMTLTGNLTLDHEGFNYYGYNTSLFEADSLPEMERSDIRQQALLFGAKAEVHSTTLDSSDLNYRLSLQYNFFTDQSDDTENTLFVKSSFGKLIGTFMGALDFNVSYMKPSENIDSASNTLIHFSPYISKRSKDWRFLAGFEGVAENSDVSRFYIYPRGLLEFTIIEKIIVPYIGVGGKLENNHYFKIMNENHFIQPGTKVKNTDHSFTAFGGIKGSLSREVGFRADVTFSTIQNMYFFINDTTTELQNTFDVEYDDIDLIQYHGELNIEPSALWNLKAGFNYYSYSTLLLDKPWHKPQYDLTLNASYNLKEKLVLSGDLIVFGKRYAKSSLFPEGMVKLDPVIDLNLGVDYLFSKLFTLFFNIYNITGRSYMLWNQYPSQRFNFMIGFSYKL